MPTVPLTTVLQNRQVFLPDPVLICIFHLIWLLHVSAVCHLQGLITKELKIQNNKLALTYVIMLKFTIYVECD